jgi:hypothetical protein
VIARLFIAVWVLLALAVYGSSGKTEYEIHYPYKCITALAVNQNTELVMRGDKYTLYNETVTYKKDCQLARLVVIK